LATGGAWEPEEELTKKKSRDTSQILALLPANYFFTDVMKEEVVYSVFG